MICTLPFGAVARVAALFFFLPLTCTISFGTEVKATESSSQAPQSPKPDPAKPIREKAQAGDKDAQFDYGCRLLYGKGGVTKDILLGVEYLDLAIKAGHAQAASVLGYEYQTGRILEKAPRKAIRYYEQAADLGDAAAAYELGRIYAAGENGIPADKKLSFHYYERALPLLQKEAEQELAEPYTKGKVLASCLTLGNMYLNGTGTSVDQKKAFSWYLKAATKGDPKAQSQVGNCYMNGTGTPQDAGEAKKWLALADSNGNQKTGLALAMLTLQNEGKAAAEKEFDKVAEKGDAPMKASIGSIYRTVYHNPPKAFLWTKQAAELGDADAQCALGVAYWKADGTEWNPVQAIKWLKKAIASGQPEASRNLSTIIQYLSAAAVIMLGALGGVFFLIRKWKAGKKKEQVDSDN